MDMSSSSSWADDLSRTPTSRPHRSSGSVVERLSPHLVGDTSLVPLRTRVFGAVVYRVSLIFYKLACMFPITDRTALRECLYELVNTGYLVLQHTPVRPDSLISVNPCIFLGVDFYSYRRYNGVNTVSDVTDRKSSLFLDRVTRLPPVLSEPTFDILRMNSYKYRVLVYAPPGFGKSTALPDFPLFVDSDDHDGPYLFTNRFELALHSRFVLFFFPSRSIFIDRVGPRVQHTYSEPETRLSLLHRWYSDLKLFLRRVPSGRFVVPNMLLTNRFFLSEMKDYINSVFSQFEFEHSAEELHDTTGNFDILFTPSIIFPSSKILEP